MNPQSNPIYCVACNGEVNARLTNGAEIYPHRLDLANLPFWICDTCNNYVGCHHKTDNPTQPKGDIPTAEVRKYRVSLHRLIDPMWQNHLIKRKKLYALMSKGIGKTYHTAHIRDKATFDIAYKTALEIKESL